MRSSLSAGKEVRAWLAPRAHTSKSLHAIRPSHYSALPVADASGDLRILCADRYRGSSYGRRRWHRLPCRCVRNAGSSASGGGYGGASGSDAVMVAELERDRHTGFWVARIPVRGCGRDCGAGAVHVRHTLPIPRSATREQAEKAYRLLCGGAWHERR